MKKMLFSTFCVVAGILAIFWGISELVIYKQLRSSGVEIKAELKEFNDPNQYSHSGQQSQASIEYCFSVKGQTYCSGEEIKDRKTYDICRQQGNQALVDVLYLESSPDICALKGSVYGGQTWSWIRIIIGIFFMIIPFYSWIEGKVQNIFFRT